MLQDVYKRQVPIDGEKRGPPLPFPFVRRRGGFHDRRGQSAGSGVSTIRKMGQRVVSWSIAARGVSPDVKKPYEMTTWPEGSRRPADEFGRATILRSASRVPQCRASQSNDFGSVGPR